MESNQTINSNPKRRGGYRPGAGRKPSAGLGASLTAEASNPDAKPIPAVSVALGLRKSPLERLYEVMANSRYDMSLRVRAMIAAAEYVHAKQPQAIHVTQDVRLAAVVVHTMPGPWEPKQTTLPPPVADAAPTGLPGGVENVPSPPLPASPEPQIDP